MRRTLASPNFATSSNNPAAICGEVLSASISTAKRGRRCGSAFIIAPSMVVAADTYWRNSVDSEKNALECTTSEPSRRVGATKTRYLSVTCEKNDGCSCGEPQMIDSKQAGCGAPSFVDDFDVSLVRTDSTRSRPS